MVKKITFFNSQTTNNWRFLRIFVIEKQNVANMKKKSPVNITEEEMMSPF